MSSEVSANPDPALNTKRVKRPGQGQRRRAQQKLRKAARATLSIEELQSRTLTKRPRKRPTPAQRQRAARFRLTGNNPENPRFSLPELVVAPPRVLKLQIPALLVAPTEGLPSAKDLFAKSANSTPEKSSTFSPFVSDKPPTPEKWYNPRTFTSDDLPEADTLWIPVESSPESFFLTPTKSFVRSKRPLLPNYFS